MQGCSTRSNRKLSYSLNSQMSNYKYTTQVRIFIFFFTRYRLLDSDNSKSHIDTLHEIGCESDIREYNAAFEFLKNKLHITSVNLFSNNPHKIKAARNTFGVPNVKISPMPAGMFLISCSVLHIS